MPSSLFVTGTDTGVGKTMVTALLALKLRSLGIDAGVMKPFASGCFRQGGVLVSADAQFLRAATGVEDPLELINPITLEEPLAPLVAARRAGVSTSDWFAIARDAYQELSELHDCVIVEGVGGILVPLAESAAGILTCQDLLGAMGLPAVVVCRRGLGTINHSLLTCATKLQPPAAFAGLVFCDAAPPQLDANGEEDPVLASSPDIIAEMTNLPVWGQVPFLAELNEGMLAAARGLEIPLEFRG